MTIDDMILELNNLEQENTVKLLDNSCVSAGAGSGKTRVLATRYVYLVAKYGFMPKEILTLTFTNKAANEMYSRIYKSLVEYSTKITEQTELKNLQKALSEFQEAKIQTLDSYCKSLITTNIHKFGITPDFSLDKNQLVKIVDKKAVEFLLKKRNNPTLQFFLGLSFPENFAKELFSKTILENSTIANPIDFEKGYELQLEYSKNQWKKYAKKANQLKNDVKNTLEEFGNNGTSSQKPKIQILYQKIDDVECIETPEDVLRFNEIKAWYSWFSDFSKLTSRYSGEIGPFVSEARDLLPLMMPYFNFLVYQKEVKEIAALLKEFQDEVMKIKRNMGLLSFNDATALAIDCLVRFPDVRSIEKKAYKAIMIDEFQDDNILQKKLLYLLSEKEELFSPTIPKPEDLNPQKLFFVGDEKQSIYKFRGADVEVFRNLSNELSGKGVLSTNYRSSPSLVAAFNTFFGNVPYPIASEEDIKKYANKVNADGCGIFKKDTEDLDAFEATYTLTKASPLKLENPDYKPSVHLRLVNPDEKEKGQDYLSPKETEAYYVADKIKRILALKNQDGKNLFEPKDIAILFRSTTNQHVYERFLRSNNIPYSCGKQKGFFYDAPINDIVALLRLCVYQNDFVSFAAFIKSPFLRLSESSVNIILSFIQNEKNKKRYISNPFEDRFKEILDLLPDDEKDRLVAGKKIVYEIKEFIKNNSIGKTITKIFQNYGYCYETMWNDSVSIYSELYDYLFVLATQADNRQENLTDFLSTLENMEKKPSSMEDISVPLERGNAVQLMTVHGSKGLEFPVVFLVGINDKPEAVSNKEYAYYHEDFGLAVKTPLHPMLDKDTKRNWVFELCRESEIKKEIAETRRILYVAMTRAEEQLFLTGIASLEEIYAEKKEKTVNFFNLLTPSFQKYINKETLTEEKNSPFTFKQIFLKQVDTFTSSNQNTAKKRQEISNIKKLAYENACLEEMPVIKDNHTSPTELKKEGIALFSMDKVVFSDFNIELAPELKTDTIIKSEKKKENGFKENNFGTLVHAYIEQCFENRNKIERFEPIYPAEILEKLNKTSLEIVKADVETLGKKFFESEIGKKALKSSWCKCEYEFKMPVLINGALSILKGIIDLLFFDENTGKVFVVDFKSDDEINPENHYQQLRLYKKAAAEICGVSENMVETKIYYLRFEKTIDIGN